uniref:Uncharacterized protein n=1 Tax=Aegilops tauschii subsp. strangulata TaxID=200361 RepID=A0A453HW85_AEGTS
LDLDVSAADLVEETPSDLAAAGRLEKTPPDLALVISSVSPRRRGHGKAAVPAADPLRNTPPIAAAGRFQPQPGVVDVRRGGVPGATVQGAGVRVPDGAGDLHAQRPARRLVPAVAL